MKKIFFTIAILLSVSFVAIGIIKYDNSSEKIEGCYFRKMYGSIGIVEGDEYIINMNMFCFNSDIDFLNDIRNLCFDNSEVSIKSLDITEHYRENDLIIYNLSFRISVKNDGQSNVTALSYTNGNNITTYELGNIAFIKKNNNSIYFKHGCDLNFIDNNSTINFDESNEEAFTISDIIIADSDMYNCLYDKNISFEPGNELIYNLGINTKVSNDIILIQPIFIIKFDGDIDEYYFTSNIPVCYENEMTYLDIMEYVK